jgi:nucleoside-diphosphate-sugar epimerase
MTGSAGFIGSRLKTHMEEAGHTVHGFDRGDGDLSEEMVFEAFLDRYLIETSVKPNIVVHLAANPGRVFGEEDPEDTLRQNTLMTLRVAQACEKQDLMLCYVSTSEIYGDQGDDFCDEITGPFGRPHNLYGLTKLWGEQVAQNYASIEPLILRPSMPYGPGQLVGHGRAALPTMIWNALRGKRITVHAGAERSWCYIDDAICAMALAIENGRGIYNIGRDDDRRSMHEIAELACQITQSDPTLIDTIPAPGQVSPVKRLSCRRIAALGFKPQVEIEEGMRLMADDLRTRLEE